MVPSLMVPSLMVPSLMVTVAMPRLQPALTWAWPSTMVIVASASPQPLLTASSLITPLTTHVVPSSGRSGSATTRSSSSMRAPSAPVRARLSPSSCTVTPAFNMAATAESWSISGWSQAIIVDIIGPTVSWSPSKVAGPEWPLQPPLNDTWPSRNSRRSTAPGARVMPVADCDRKVRPSRRAARSVLGVVTWVLPGSVLGEPAAVVGTESAGSVDGSPQAASVNSPAVAMASRMWDGVGFMSSLTHPGPLRFPARSCGDR